jgi:large subunit ribosomal protein L4
MKTEIYNLKNESVGAADVPESLFGAPWKPDLVHQVLCAQLANKRRPWAHAKGRGEVRGGGRKPWRQKGTGRARHGSIRSPLWRHGGKSHGPSKERDYSQKINKKMRRGAIISVLSKKFRDGEIKFIENLHIDEAKTKIAAAVLRALVQLPKKNRKFDALLVPRMEEKNIFRASANLPKAKALHPGSLNVFDLMNYKRVLIDKEAVPFLERHYISAAK